MSADRCPRCDDPICGVPAALVAADGIPGFGEVCSDDDNAKWSALGAAYLECAKRPAADWRARAIAAESRIAQVAAELADDLATAQAEIDRATANPGGMGATLPSSSRLRHGATPTVRVWLGRLVEKLRGAPVPRATATIKEPS